MSPNIRIDRAPSRTHPVLCWPKPDAESRPYPHKKLGILLIPCRNVSDEPWLRRIRDGICYRMDSRLGFFMWHRSFCRGMVPELAKRACGLKFKIHSWCASAVVDWHIGTWIFHHSCSCRRQRCFDGYDGLAGTETGCQLASARLVGRQQAYIIYVHGPPCRFYVDALCFLGWSIHKKYIIEISARCPSLIP